jgi:hypothetical protein
MGTMDGLRIPTKDEQEIIASVARMVDRLRAAKFEPKCVVLNDQAWGIPENHWSFILGLPVVHRPGADWPAIQIGVLAP